MAVRQRVADYTERVGEAVRGNVAAVETENDQDGARDTNQKLRGSGARSSLVTVGIEVDAGLTAGGSGRWRTPA